ncbi:SurA-like protein [Prauserella shujinwangii]|uniref:SurA-like protein n=1 Tax=Prauserella shujinwangii TaxID=1453103 RepID=A0A2T0M025_9PSEU|nr:SurA N-terminal domain-containing protein [Prauserella shujinwangii]PRX49956.1 SurA-like protein [Prauserella shujinwangii]
MTRIIRRPATLVLALIASLVLAGCGSGPSQVTSAAIIGDHAIPLDDVQREIQWVLDNVPEAKQAQQQGNFAQQSREIVRSRIIHHLVTVAAQREGLRADPAQIEELINSSGGTESIARSIGIAPERVRDAAADQVLLQQLARRYADRVSVRLVGTTIREESAESTAEEKALALGRRIAADPGAAERIIRDGGYQVLDQELALADALQNQPEIAISSVFGAGEGSVIVIQPSREQTGWLVGLIRDRKVTAGGSQQSVQQASGQVLYWAGVRMLQPIADELGVRVNPRYGVWDATEMAPAASEDEVTGYQLSPRTVQP